MPKQTIDFTYETGTNEALHPDPAVNSRFIEVAMSECYYGCKIYADPMSNVKVLGHNATYGCRVKRKDVVLTAPVVDEQVPDCESVYF